MLGTKSETKLRVKKASEMISLDSKKLPRPKQIILEKERKMVIKSLEINNFRGIKNLHFDFSKKINVFSGRNGIGKTSVIDSIMWVLCDETLVYEKQNADNRNTNNLRDVVNVALELANETTSYKLERNYYDTYKEDLNGNFTFARTVNEFKINGAKYGSKEYFDFIKYNILKLDRNVIIPKEFNIIRAIVDFNYFGKIDYKIARSFLENILGLESDEEILQDEKFALVKKELQMQKYDVTKTVSKLKSDLESGKNIIASQSATLKQYEEEYDEEKYSKLIGLQEERNNLINTKVAENTEILGLNRLLQEVEENIKAEEKGTTEAIFEAQNKISNLSNKGISIDYTVQNKGLEIKSLLDHNKQIASMIEQNEKKLEGLQNRTLPKTECPNCGYQLNADEVKKFEENLKIEKNKIVSENELAKQSIEENKNKCEELLKEIDDLKKNKDELGEQYFAEKEKLDNLRNDKGTDLLQILKNRKIELANQIAEKTNELIDEKDKKMRELNAQIEGSLSQVGLPQKIEDLKKTIKNNKLIANNIEICIDLAKEFKRTKIAKIKDKVNEVFPQLDIEILEENQNTGTIKEVCYLKLHNTEYKGINDGHRKMIGITFIENIKQKLQLENLPIIFDKLADVDREMLQKISDITKSQIFTTKVGEEEEITLL